MTVAIDDAVTGVVISPRAQEIITHERAADEHQTKSDEHRWEAARLINEELDAGKSQRQLANEIHKSQMHVSRMSRVWQKWGESYRIGAVDRSFSSLEQELRWTTPRKAYPPSVGSPNNTQAPALSKNQDPDEVLEGEIIDTRTIAQNAVQDAHERNMNPDAATINACFANATVQLDKLQQATPMPDMPNVRHFFSKVEYLKSLGW